MRFKKGSKVEVLCKKEVPLGAWRCAEIISGNGHSYSVMYDWSSSMENEVFTDRVLRKAIRPCPPPARSVENWAVGDVVEVLDICSWKIATILKVLDGARCLVRLLGSCLEFTVHQSKIRIRQTWKDDRWIVFEKGSGSSEVMKSNNLANLNCCKVRRVDTRIKIPASNDCLALEENIGFQDSHFISSRSLKRASPFCSSYIEAYPSKVRAIEKRSECQQVLSRSPSSLLKKVDAVAYPRENLGQKDMHTSFSNQTTGYYEMEGGNLNGAISCFLERSSEPSDCDSDRCSVGSCSVNRNSLNKLSSKTLAGPSQDANTICSDAESFNGHADEEEKFHLPLKDEEAASIHRLELHAYHSTLVAMYVSGPLSWEQEALLTNLRISLHISNDEHLMELRNLISSGKSLYLS
ncbi:hypothetical protein FEM48_Zijuj06G0147600 [Ziziphus jujuba var. spinosa]|uniref:ENT domain-containing protein n=1 Tax=Ziziphus jujuba var. spinosa TaxID=714518 RepID=A0A978V9W7_ZIZJJ|nr:hypothetical protein FEM48_Zijuj06G0147600 [Ziziphus jujuba var. spinosa]